jgi:large subunit ribosomal protein L24
MQLKKSRIKKDDQVMVVTGKEKGKTGTVTIVTLGKGTVMIDKLNIVKRHMKPSAKHKHGGIVEKEAPIAISNVMLICGKCKRPVRMGIRRLADGSRVRYCKKCDEVLDK